MNAQEDREGDIAMAETAEKKMSKAKKILIAVVAIVVALLVVVDIAVSSYLVNYAIGRAGDGGDRNVEEVVIEAEGTVARIEAERAAQAVETAKFLNAVPGEPVEITAAGGIHLAGIVYEHATSDDASTPTDSQGPSASDASASASSQDSSVSDISIPTDSQSSSDTIDPSTIDPALLDQASPSGATTSPDDRWALVVHGYRDTNQSGYVLDMVQHYYAAGFNVLTPDLRASGQSEGDYVGMGWLDRLDILDWIDWILAQNADAQIVVHGVSMGAATTMMVAGEETPAAVVAFVEDCGYTSVWDVFSSELSRRFGLPEFPLLHSASALSGLMAGYSFEEASALEAVARSEKPMLFIHGTADDFIPFDMMGQLYDAKTAGDKEMLISEGAGHAEAMYELGDAYWDTVLGFVDRYVGQ